MDLGQRGIYSCRQTVHVGAHIGDTGSKLNSGGSREAIMPVSACPRLMTATVGNRNAADIAVAYGIWTGNGGSLVLVDRVRRIFHRLRGPHHVFDWPVCSESVGHFDRR